MEELITTWLPTILAAGVTGGFGSLITFMATKPNRQAEVAKTVVETHGHIIDDLQAELERVKLQLIRSRDDRAELHDENSQLMRRIARIERWANANGLRLPNGQHEDVEGVPI